MAQKLTKKEFDKKVSAMRETNERLRILHEIKTERAKYCTNEDKKKAKTSNIILMIAIIAITLYTIAALIIQYNTGTEVSSTLSTLWYGFWTVEITVLAGIKVTKVIKENNSDSINDDENDENVVG